MTQTAATLPSGVVVAEPPNGWRAPSTPDPEMPGVAAYLRANPETSVALISDVDKNTADRKARSLLSAAGDDKLHFHVTVRITTSAVRDSNDNVTSPALYTTFAVWRSEARVPRQDGDDRAISDDED